METLEGTVLPFGRFGWYFRPSTQMYEFWWMGDVPKMCISAEIVPAMPTRISDEINFGVAIKASEGILDD